MTRNSFFFLVLFFSIPVVTFADSSVVPDNGLAPYTTQLTATVQTVPPTITISWPREENAGVRSYFVYRRTTTDPTWYLFADSLSSTTLAFVDTNVATGTIYEYRVIKSSYNPTFVNGYGYIYSGVGTPLQDNRGTVILIVDNSQSLPLASELTQLKTDLVNDGWTVVRHDVASTSSVVSVKALITADWSADPTNVKQVFLFGHIPVPYSGYFSPDGHTDHTGAWPADAYYGNMTGTWTDATVNTTSASDPRNWNIPGDGKFDQSAIPNLNEVAVGRVDLSNMPAFAPKTETDLLRQYLNKNHQYRIKGTIVPINQGLMADNFGAAGGDAYAGSGWRAFSTLVGGANIISSSTGYFSEQATTSFLWTYGAGGGYYTGAGGIGNTSDFAASSPHGVFNMLFGSYFGDWDNSNNFLRAPLAASGWGLTSIWSGRPWWVLDHMGLGETIGYEMMATLNNKNGTYFPFGFVNDVDISLMGDPTLRQNLISSPGNLVSSSTERVTDLTWSASTDSNIAGYNIYRSTSSSGSYVRRTPSPVAATTYRDTATTSASYYYMVRAVRLETTPSGSYWNASEGTTTGPVSIVVINTPPTIAAIADQSGYSDAATSVQFNVGDAESNLDSLIITASSTDSSIVSNSGLVATGSGASRTLTIQPAANASGTTTIAVSVSDGQYVASTTFVFTSSVRSVPVVVVTGSGSGGGGGGGGGGNSYVTVVATSTVVNPSNVVATTTLAAAPYVFVSDLSPGDINSKIIKLQIYLNTHGFPVASTGPGSLGHETSFFGPATVLAVKAFQRARHIEPTGNLGPLTRAALNTVMIPSVVATSTSPIVQATTTAPLTVVSGTFKRDLSVGATGADVLALQLFLNKHGYIVSGNGPGSPGEETTYFGIKTANALTLFQEDHSISQDKGTMSGATRTLINTF